MRPSRNGRHDVGLVLDGHGLFHGSSLRLGAGWRPSAWTPSRSVRFGSLGRGRGRTRRAGGRWTRRTARPPRASGGRPLVAARPLPRPGARCGNRTRRAALAAPASVAGPAGPTRARTRASPRVAPEEAGAGLLEHLELGVALVDARCSSARSLASSSVGPVISTHSTATSSSSWPGSGSGSAPGGAGRGCDAGRSDGAAAVPPASAGSAFRGAARALRAAALLGCPVRARRLRCLHGVLGPPLLAPPAVFAPPFVVVPGFAALFALAFVPPLVPPLLVPAPLAPLLAGFPPLALGPTRGPLSAMVWRSEARIPLDARPWPWRPRSRRSRRGGSGCRARPGTSSG